MKESAASGFPFQPELTRPPAAWMTTEAASRVLKALSGRSGNPGALFVGGCVRHYITGEEVEDIDIATVFPPKDVMEKLSAAGIRAIPTGIEHGTVTAVVDSQHYEITTLRRDVRTDGRHAEVAFSEDWREDALRRDFTMNTLLADAAGRVFDPTGRGLKDLQEGRVVFVGEPAARIAEDYLRVLRFFRFHARYGRGDPDVPALQACAAAAAHMGRLSAERVTQEFFKILAAAQPVPALKLLFSHGILTTLSAPGFDPEFMQWVCDFQSRFGLVAISTRLLILAGLSLENVKEFSPPLLIPRVFRRDMEALTQVLARPGIATPADMRALVYQCGRHAAAQAVMVGLAQDRIMNGSAPELLRVVQEWTVPDFPVSGDDVLKAGFSAGPAVGEKLNALEQAWIESDFTLTRDALLKMM